MQAGGPSLWNVKGLYHYSWQLLICSPAGQSLQITGTQFHAIICVSGVRGVDRAAATRVYEEAPTKGRLWSSTEHECFWSTAGGWLVSEFSWNVHTLLMSCIYIVFTGRSDSNKAALPVTQVLVNIWASSYEQGHHVDLQCIQEDRLWCYSLLNEDHPSKNETLFSEVYLCFSWHHPCLQ